ncbi:MarR family winged helix-turn-helix transcriptional regulator [Aeromicrobium fastidiosum]|nr:MarR family transcriptional regulator [Aeromicrobium fastidiosum]MBP2389067.1 DNA-binding MarR family transcriptional regulator [Aeromicrobium fastidiosum]
MQPAVMPSAPVTDEVPTTEEAVLRFVMAMGRRIRARIDGDTVDPSQAAILYSLSCRGPMRLGDLAESMRLDASTVSRHVHQLGEHEFVRRDPDPADGRASIIDITAEGRTALRRTFDQRRAFVSEALADWSDDDRTRLRDDITRLTADLGDS